MNGPARGGSHLLLSDGVDLVAVDALPVMECVVDLDAVDVDVPTALVFVLLPTLELPDMVGDAEWLKDDVDVPTERVGGLEM